MTCAAWPTASGPTTRVTPSQANELPSIVAAAVPGATITLADGTYRPTVSGESARRIVISTPGVTLRSESNNAAAVILDGEYNTGEIISVQASQVTLAHLTITHAGYHAVHVTPPAGGNNLSGVVLYGLQLDDETEQFVKVNSNGQDAWVDQGVIRCSSFLMTSSGRGHAGAGCYTGGIDIHGGRGWVIDHNRFEGIWCGTGLAEHAVHVWRGGRDTVVENNTLVDCARGIGLGLGSGAGQFERTYPDNPYPSVSGYVGHYGGVVRNNVVYAAQDVMDTGVGLESAPGAKVFHNTIINADGQATFFSSVDVRFQGFDVEVRNNLLRNVTSRNGASPVADHNLANAGTSLFANAQARDFHLTANATQAIDQGIVVVAAGLDMDGEPHSAGAAPDLGADER